MSPISRVGVIGGGQMGAGIAEVCARAGLDVIVRETDDQSEERARQRINGSLARALGRGKISADAHDRALARISYKTDLEVMHDRDLVVEAVVEDLDAKVEIHRLLDQIVPAEGILATNTSSIPIIDLGMVTKHPDRFVGLHFFNPVPVQRLVEVIPSLRTSAETVERVAAFASLALEKEVIRCTDRAGFVVNALLVPYLLSAIRMVESGTATAKDIDAGMKLGCAHPMGPLELADLIGLDTTASIAESMYEEFKEPSFAPPPLLRRMVTAGKLGRKAGSGFYDYA